ATLDASTVCRLFSGVVVGLTTPALATLDVSRETNRARSTRTRGWLLWRPSGLVAEQLEQACQLFLVVEVKFDLPALVPSYPQPRSRMPAQIVFQLHVATHASLGRSRRSLGISWPLELFGLSYRQLSAHDLLVGPLAIRFGLREYRPGVSSADGSSLQAVQDYRGQCQQAKSLRDGAAALPHGRSDLLLVQAEVKQLLEGLRLLDVVQILALQVLDDRDLEGLAIREFADDRRDRGEAGGLRSSETALPGDHLVPAIDRTDHYRL